MNGAGVKNVDGAPRRETELRVARVDGRPLKAFAAIHGEAWYRLLIEKFPRSYEPDP